MHVTANGVRLFFDVEGTKLVPDGPRMREKRHAVIPDAGEQGIAVIRDFIQARPQRVRREASA